MKSVEKELPEVYGIISRDHAQNGKNSAVSKYVNGGCTSDSAEPVLALVMPYFESYEMSRLLALYDAVWSAHQVGLLHHINFSNRKIREEARKYGISDDRVWPAKLVDIEEISVGDPEDIGSAIAEILSVLMKMRDMESFLETRADQLLSS
ncbi:MAG: hypothetical protein Q7R67_00190 [bacterium]|nr:hypothetical protein [bacterium]